MKRSVSAILACISAAAACAPIQRRVAPPTVAVPVNAEPAPIVAASPVADVPAESPAPVLAGAPPPSSAADVASLRALTLLVPVRGVPPTRIEDSFDAPRDGGRRHDAVDILAPRGTPVLSASDGTVRRVGTNALGGNVVWVADPQEHYAFYYAHLDRFAAGLKVGESVRRGTVLGYVGTTGNAPPNVPHLHFQIVRITDAKSWWSGPPVNPAPYLAEGAVPVPAPRHEDRPE